MFTNVNLDKRYKEILFAAAGLGPNLLMTLMMAYFTDALIPTGLQADINFWSYGGVIIVYTAIFPILWTIGRVVDGMIDVPLAVVADNLKNKKGIRYLALLVSVVPMIASFICCWIPICGHSPNMDVNALIGNSFWIFFCSIIFFGSYTFALITFYGSLSEVCANQTQRARVASYKSAFDTISYALVYAAIPAIFKAINVPIHQVAIYLSPLMLTILIPIFLRSKKGQEKKINPTESVSFGKSFVLTVKSKPFVKWLFVSCCTFFGLQMFLVAQNSLISGVMNLNVTYAAILNTFAFAPVPLMLFLFNKLRKSKGERFMYQICIVSFALGIFTFALAGQYLWGDNVLVKMLIGSIGAIIGSIGISGFFMMPYLVPTTIASVEEKITKKNHSAMYFAVQALVTSISGAIASSLIYDYLKQWTVPDGSGGTWKCGVSLVPLIVFVVCLIAFLFCFFMPKRYTAKTIYYDLISSANDSLNRIRKKQKKINDRLIAKIASINKKDVHKSQKEVAIFNYKKRYEKSLKILKQQEEELLEVINYKFTSTSSAGDEENRLIANDSVLVNVLLFILTAGIFGIIVLFIDISKLKKLGVKIKKSEYLWLILSLFIPFLNIYTTNYFNSHIIKIADQRKLKIKTYPILSLISNLILPLFLNIMVIGIRTNNFNVISDDIFKKENKNMPQVKAKPQKTYQVKSWKPFLVMVIIGAIFATVAIVCYEMASIVGQPYKTLEEMPADVLAAYWIYLGVAIGCTVPAAGLLGPGIPLMVVRIVRNNKANKAKK